MSADTYDEVMISLGLEPSSPGRGGPRRSAAAAHKQGRPKVDHGHGDHRTYIKGCRCDDCREAHRLQCIKWRAARAQDPAGADRAGHGKASTYRNYHCRCAACTAANTADCNAYRARRRQKAALAETGGAA